MKIAIRADASPEIGSGHLVRCLSLADALAARGAAVSFICRRLPDALARAAANRGYSLSLLPLAAPAGLEAPQQAWPASHQADDASATEGALQGSMPDWLVVDHYGLDRTWELAMRRHASHLMAIDDLGRAHQCDLLLDASIHADAPARYAASLGSGTIFLGGPGHALLRAEFAGARAGVGVRRGPVRRLLVFMGGMDAGNATGRVLDALVLLGEVAPALDVVIGAAHPARQQIEAFCGKRPDRRCHVQTDHMASLLAACDMAVGAGGGATWERCCLGVPTLAMALAENQHALLAGAARSGLVYVPDGGLPASGLLATHLRALLGNEALRESLSAAGMAMVDGRGADRVAAALFGTQIRVRPARSEDCDSILAWRNDPAVRAMSRFAGEISPEAHRRWFDEVLHSPDRPLLVGEDHLGPVGVVRFDLDGREAEVSIYLVASRLGQGLGGGLLRAAEAWLASHRPAVSTIHAETLGSNTASRRLFELGGYQLSAQRFSKRIEAP
jgi:UDP-2,4-diacetamido-2,4,6-trideoxy-beta-L-altropyranose hydrolase